MSNTIASRPVIRASTADIAAAADVELRVDAQP